MADDTQVQSVLGDPVAVTPPYVTVTSPATATAPAEPAVTPVIVESAPAETVTVPETQTGTIQTPEPVVTTTDAEIPTEVPTPSTPPVTPMESVTPQATATPRAPQQNTVATPPLITHVDPRSFLSKALSSIQFRKKAKLEKIMKLAQEKKSITNDQVEKLLHVSDATAQRYLSALVKQGRLKQIGVRGSTHYELI